MFEHELCCACRSDKLRFIKGFQKKYLLRCDECGLVFDQRVPDEKVLAAHYATYSYSQRKAISAATRLSFSNLLDQFEGYREHNNILDVGCGQGDFLIAAKERGWSVYGSEYSPAAVKLCTSEGIIMYEGEFYGDVFGHVKFDVVTSFEVLEHTNAPNTLIAQSIKPLKVGGLFYLTTPNFNSILRYLEKANFKILAYPEHLVIYTPKSLMNLFSQYSLVKVKLLTTGIDLFRLKNYFRKYSFKEEINTSSSSRLAANNSFRDITSSGKGGLIKNIINSILTVIGKGDTIKAFYIKDNEK